MVADGIGCQPSQAESSACLRLIAALGQPNADRKGSLHGYPINTYGCFGPAGHIPADPASRPTQHRAFARRPAYDGAPIA